MATDGAASVLDFVRNPDASRWIVLEVMMAILILLVLMLFAIFPGIVTWLPELAMNRLR